METSCQTWETNKLPQTSLDLFCWVLQFHIRPGLFKWKNIIEIKSDNLDTFLQEEFIVRTLSLIAKSM